MRLEPELADDETARADDQDGRQVGQVPLDVGVFLLVIRGLGKNQAGLATCAACLTAAVTALTCYGSYFQITYVPWPMGGISVPYGTTSMLW